MNNFGYVEIMKVIFFLKCGYFYEDFENAIKLPKNVDGFEDSCVWTCCESFYQLWTQYMWSGVKELKSGPKISDLMNTHDTQLNLFDIIGTLG